MGFWTTMTRAFWVVLLVLALGPRASASDLDGDTLRGMDAEVRADWFAAVTCFERAANAAPDAKVRRERLRYARARGGAFWRTTARALLASRATAGAAVATAIARVCDPDHRDLARLLKDAKKAGVKVPDRVPDLVPAHPAFPVRSDTGRLLAFGPLGVEGERAQTLVKSALEFLVKAQRKDGSWVSPYDQGRSSMRAGVTGLVLLALVTEGPGLLKGPRAEAARKAVSWLLESQDRTGCIGGQLSTRFMYGHSIACRALAEYAILSSEYKRIRPVLEKARNFHVRAQSAVGGWRYGIKPEDSDTSITYWAVLALDRMRRAGVAIDQAMLHRASGFVLSITDREWGKAGYTTTGTGPARPEDLIDEFTPDKSEALTAAAFTIRHVVGVHEPRLDAAQLKLIRDIKPRSIRPDMYYWHTGLEALARASSPIPRNWFAACVNSVEALRKPDGSIAPDGVWGREGGIHYSTAICVLALMAPSTEPERGSALPASDFRRTGQRHIRVPAGIQPVETSIYLDAGESVVIEPSGKITCCRRADKTGPEGHRRPPKGQEKLVRTSPYGCLLARIGPEGKLVAIKKTRKFKARHPGELVLLINQKCAEGASGAFNVEIRLAD
jgi:hypothetical protein